MPRKAENANQV